MKVKTLLTSLVLFLLTGVALALTSPFANLGEIASLLNLEPYRQTVSVRTVKIAVLDNGFKSHQAELGRSLPKNTVYRPGPVAVDPAKEESHGLFMAQLMASLLAQTSGISYELHLFSTFGYSNLAQAVETLIAEKFDVALYSQVWEYGGNGDGRGFINALVNRATQAGVVWINAAGNFADATFRAPVQVADDNWIRLPGPNHSVRVRCLNGSPNSKCALRIVLSWNDFKDDVSEGTDKDLDLVLSDDTLNIIRTSGLQQKKVVPEGQPGASLYPREIIQAEIDPGLYLIRVKMRSSNFDPTRDRLRIVTSGDFTQLLDQSPGETLLPPADNASVITIGASDSNKSSSSLTLKKPELLFPSLITLTSGESFKGSSNSAAVAATAVAILKALRPSLSRTEIIESLSTTRHVPSLGQGLPLQKLQFHPTGPGCFQKVNLPYFPEPANEILHDGGVPVMTTGGRKIFTPYDPFTRVTGVRRINEDDMLVVNNFEWEVWPRSRQWQLTPYMFEVVQQPLGQVFCGWNGYPEVPQVESNGWLRLPSFN